MAVLNWLHVFKKTTMVCDVANLYDHDRHFENPLHGVHFRISNVCNLFSECKHNVLEVKHYAMLICIHYVISQYLWRQKCRQRLCLVNCK